MLGRCAHMRPSYYYIWNNIQLLCEIYVLNITPNIQLPHMSQYAKRQYSVACTYTHFCLPYCKVGWNMYCGICMHFRKLRNQVRTQYPCTYIYHNHLFYILPANCVKSPLQCPFCCVLTVPFFFQTTSSHPSIKLIEKMFIYTSMFSICLEIGSGWIF